MHCMPLLEMGFNQEVERKTQPKRIDMKGTENGRKSKWEFRNDYPCSCLHSNSFKSGRLKNMIQTRIVKLPSASEWMNARDSQTERHSKMMMKKQEQKHQSQVSTNVCYLVDVNFIFREMVNFSWNDSIGAPIVPPFISQQRIWCKTPPLIRLFTTISFRFCCFFVELHCLWRWYVR